MDWPLRRVISGGQSGADRAGLEVARVLGIETGGTAPKGYRTEFGPDLALRDVFGLVESSSPDYASRTLANVRAGLGTVVFGRLSSTGTSLTLSYCRVSGKPWLANPTAEELRHWVMEFEVATLNVAGNRHSTDPAIFYHAAATLLSALRSSDQLAIGVPDNPHAGR